MSTRPALSRARREPHRRPLRRPTTLSPARCPPAPQLLPAPQRAAQRAQGRRSGAPADAAGAGGDSAGGGGDLRLSRRLVHPPQARRGGRQGLPVPRGILAPTGSCCSASRRAALRDAQRGADLHPCPRRARRPCPRRALLFPGIRVLMFLSPSMRRRGVGAALQLERAPRLGLLGAARNALEISSGDLRGPAARPTIGGRAQGSSVAAAGLAMCAPARPAPAAAAGTKLLMPILQSGGLPPVATIMTHALLALLCHNPRDYCQSQVGCSDGCTWQLLPLAVGASWLQPAVSGSPIPRRPLRRCCATR